MKRGFLRKKTLKAKTFRVFFIQASVPDQMAGNPAVVICAGEVNLVPVEAVFNSRAVYQRPIRWPAIQP